MKENDFCTNNCDFDWKTKPKKKKCLKQPGTYKASKLKKSDHLKQNQ